MNYLIKKNQIFLMILISILVFLFSCTPKNNRHIGIWEAELPLEGKIIWQFDEDTLKVKIMDQVYTCPYKIDYSKKPIELDYQMPDQKLRCIIEFLGPNSFRVTGEDHKGKPRPTSFNKPEDVIIFHRVK